MRRRGFFTALAGILGALAAGIVAALSPKSSPFEGELLPLVPGRTEPLEMAAAPLSESGSKLPFMGWMAPCPKCGCEKRRAVGLMVDACTGCGAEFDLPTSLVSEVNYKAFPSEEAAREVYGSDSFIGGEA